MKQILPPTPIIKSQRTYWPITHRWNKQSLTPPHGKRWNIPGDFPSLTPTEIDELSVAEEAAQ